MQFKKKYLEKLGATIELTAFVPEGKTAEWHAMLHVEPRGESFQEQFRRIYQAEACLLGSEDVAGAKPVFKRYFLSDATNQRPLMAQDNSCTVSYIQQPPLDGSKLALWLYLQRGTEVTPTCDRLRSTIVRHNGYEHLWTMGMLIGEGSSYSQTQTLLEDYEQLLEEHQMTLEDNCIRTWFFVRDVDTQYKGLVLARWENFAQHGLVPETHYIASTGIGGNPSDPKAIIQLGSYALKGFKPEQQRYLYAASHLNRTAEYGVTFERGTLLKFGDRNHAIISGTASINNKGEVEHVGDIEMQTRRMWENVETLLGEAGMTMDNAVQLIVYLRDGADYEKVRGMFSEKYPNIPTVFTLAPVCRPTWLIEMECMAIQEAENGEFNDF
jgi:enamine deaminase RidA (YjgF/YER057c/UK114 family)